jgi:hypothetical protein
MGRGPQWELAPFRLDPNWASRDREGAGILTRRSHRAPLRHVPTPRTIRPFGAPVCVNSPG